MAKLKVGVVFGGRSVEHDVSIVTAHQVMAAIEGKHEVVPIYVTKEGDWFTGDALNDLDVYKNKRWAEVGESAFISPVAGSGGLTVLGGRFKGPRIVPLDVVIPAIHGTFGEDGTLQGLLDLADIAYAGSGVAASAVGMDKPTMKSVFKAAGLPVLDHVLVDTARLGEARDEVIAEIEDRIGFPAFVKPSRLGSSVGIGKGSDRPSLEAALEVAASYDRRILVEPAAEGCIEVNCSVIGGNGVPARPSICEQPVAAEEFLSFTDKYMRSDKSGGAAGGKAEGMASLDRRIPAPISDSLTSTVQANAVKAFEAIDAAGVARVDSFVNEATGETWVMEINTVPGSFSFYLWEESGLGFPELVQQLIDIACAGHHARSKLMFSFDSGMLDGQGSKSYG
jgi:D-alanine-D-alanine ligase